MHGDSRACAPHPPTSSARLVARRASQIERLEDRITPAAGVLDLSALVGTNGFVMGAEGAGDNAGATVSDAGDFNGDGFDDLLIGAERADGNGTDSGAVYVLFGTAAGFPAQLPLSFLDGTIGFQIVSNISSTQLGFGLTGAGDFNNDGFDDLLIGAGNSDFNGLNSGSAYLVFGSAGPFGKSLDVATLNGINGFRIDGNPDDELGRAVSEAGDFNNDGFDDLLIGADGLAAKGPNTGGAYLLFGSNATMPSVFRVSALDGTNGFQINGVAADNEAGATVRGGGDFNGDGFSDLLIGSEDDSASSSGDAYVVFGKGSGLTPTFDLSTLDGTNGFRIIPETQPGQVGLGTFRSGFDINNDGLGDLIVGNPDHGFVLFGSTALPAPSFDLTAVNGSNGVRIDPPAGAHFSGAASAGDFNGDAIPDFMVAFNGERPGGAVGSLGYLVFGAVDVVPSVIDLATLDRAKGFRIVGPADQSFEELQLDLAGDVNGDGFADLVFGALNVDTNGAESGAAYVIFGFDNRITVTNNRTAQFVDADGDRVTVKVTKGALTPLDITLGPAGELLTLDLAREGERLAGANVLVKAKRFGGGNGLVDLGFLQATNVDLGKVKIDGTLGRFIAGDLNDQSAALKTITAQALGSIDDPGTTLVSEIVGDTSAIIIKGDVRHAAVDARGRLGKVSIGGDLVGNGSASAPSPVAGNGGVIIQNAGGIPVGAFVATSIDEFTVEGNITGGSVNAAEDIGLLIIRGDLTNGSIVAERAIRIIKVQGDVRGIDPAQPVTISALGPLDPASPAQALGIQKLSVGGDLENASILLGFNKLAEAKNPDATIGKVVVKGDWRAASLVAGIIDPTANGFGRDDAVFVETPADAILARIGSVIIKGSAVGSADPARHFGITAQAIGKLSIGGAEILLEPTLRDDLLLDAANNNFRVVEL